MTATIINKDYYY